MNVKNEVRERIVELTRFAYERGYRDGAQLALAEIESFVTEDVVQELVKSPRPLEEIPETTAVKKKPAQSRSKRTTKRRTKPKRNVSDRSKPKTVVVQEALQALLDAKGEVRRDEVLAAAQAENPAVTKFDLSNGLRNLVKQSKIRVSSDDNAVLLPAA